MTKYYVLFINEAGRWVIEFGDYDRSTVVFEASTHREKGVPRKCLHIAGLPSSRQSTINAYMEKLNAAA